MFIFEKLCDQILLHIYFLVPFYVCSYVLIFILWRDFIFTKAIDIGMG